MSLPHEALWLCRLGNAATDDDVGLNDTGFCAFELPDCRGCTNDSSPVYIVSKVDDPMTSAVLIRWLNGELRAAR